MLTIALFVLLLIMFTSCLQPLALSGVIAHVVFTRQVSWSETWWYLHVRCMFVTWLLACYFTDLNLGWWWPTESIAVTSAELYSTAVSHNLFLNTRQHACFHHKYKWRHVIQHLWQGINIVHEAVSQYVIVIVLYIPHLTQINQYFMPHKL